MVPYKLVFLECHHTAELISPKKSICLITKTIFYFYNEILIVKLAYIENANLAIIDISFCSVTLPSMLFVKNV